MKIERLRKSHKKEIIIGVVLTIVIGGALTFKLTHSKYRFTQSIDLATGKINYKVPDFQIIAMQQSDDGINYSDITIMPSSGYVINTEKSFCNLNGSKDNNAKLYTENEKHIFESLSKGNKCFLYFDKYIPTASKILIENFENITEKSNFSNIAVTNEGVYIANDLIYGNGLKTYYWRGAVTDNHVIFAEKCWRIVRINGDKTIRLIYNGMVQSGNTCTGNGANSSAVIIGTTESEKYYATSDGKANNSSYVGWTYKLGYQRPTSTTSDTEITSNAKKQTEAWYNKNIGIPGSDNDNKVAKGKFCNDRRIENDENWTTSLPSQYYAGFARLVKNKTPEFSCNKDDIYELKIGAITADEIAFAGGVFGTNNLSYYLYTGQNYWTMSPFYLNNSLAHQFIVNITGDLSNTIVSDVSGLRPVINLKSNVTFSSGNGTQSSPYIIAD